jgi:hypothetical protein
MRAVPLFPVCVFSSPPSFFPLIHMLPGATTAAPAAATPSALIAPIVPSSKQPTAPAQPSPLSAAVPMEAQVAPVEAIIPSPTTTRQDFVIKRFGEARPQRPPPNFGLSRIRELPDFMLQTVKHTLDGYARASHPWSTLVWNTNINNDALQVMLAHWFSLVQVVYSQLVRFNTPPDKRKQLYLDIGAYWQVYLWPTYVHVAEAGSTMLIEYVRQMNDNGEPGARDIEQKLFKTGELLVQIRGNDALQLQQLEEEARHMRTGYEARIAQLAEQNTNLVASGALAAAASSAADQQAAQTLATCRAEKAALATQLEQRTARVSEVAEQQRDTEARMADTQAALDRANADLATERAETARLRRAAAGAAAPVRDELEQVRAELASATQQRDECRAEVALLQRQAADLRTQTAAARTTIESMEEAARSAAASAREAATQGRADLLEEVARVRAEKASLESANTLLATENGRLAGREQQLVAELANARAATAAVHESETVAQLRQQNQVLAASVREADDRVTDANAKVLRASAANRDLADRKAVLEQQLSDAHTQLAAQEDALSAAGAAVQRANAETDQVRAQVVAERDAALAAQQQRANQAEKAFAQQLGTEHARADDFQQQIAALRLSVAAAEQRTDIASNAGHKAVDDLRTKTAEVAALQDRLAVSAKERDARVLAETNKVIVAYSNRLSAVGTTLLRSVERVYEMAGDSHWHAPLEEIPVGIVSDEPGTEEQAQPGRKRRAGLAAPAPERGELNIAQRSRAAALLADAKARTTARKKAAVAAAAPSP